MPDVLVRNVPQSILDALKRRAARHRRSLQQEMRDILDTAAREAVRPDPAGVAEAIRAKLAQRGRTYSDSVPLIREDRDR